MGKEPRLSWEQQQITRFHEMPSHEWIRHVEQSRTFPMGSKEDVDELIRSVGQEARRRGAVLIFWQPIGLEPDTEIPTPSKKMYDAGHVIFELLGRLPRSVATGEDQNFEVIQVRMLRGGTFDDDMGVTSLLMYYLHEKPTGECFLPASDRPSHQSWEGFKKLAGELQQGAALEHLQEGVVQPIE